jgi:polyphosphate glucokinase
MNILGIDIGGSGIKGAPVDSITGQLLAERYRIPTPRPATPKAVTKTLVKIVEHFKWTGPIGCGFPAAINHRKIGTASNID